MAYISVEAPMCLQGEVWLQGSKNAVLPILAATLLGNNITILHNCPDIQDVDEMLELLRLFACKCEKNGKDIIVDSRSVTLVSDEKQQILAERMKKMRASIILLGAILGRFGEARVFYPGGCKIGERKIDIHLQCLKALGYHIDAHEETKIQAKGFLREDVKITLPFASVGATENAILASVRSAGHVVMLENVAREPEIIELCTMLNAMGADIRGAGNKNIIIRGVTVFRDCELAVSSDRIVAGTYAAALLATGGEITMRGIRPKLDDSVWNLYRVLGMECMMEAEVLRLRLTKPRHWFQKGHYLLATAPYPGFPTDLQSQMMAVFTCHMETAVIIENIFENRLQTAEMLNRMGADIQIVSERIAMITGVDALKGCRVEATDLRGGAALVLAGLMAEGVTEVYGIDYIKRGYEDICRDFSLLGVRIHIRT